MANLGKGGGELFHPVTLDLSEIPLGLPQRFRRRPDLRLHLSPPIPLFFVDARSELVKIEAARAFNDLQRQHFEASLARLTPDSSLRDYLSAEHQLSPSPYQKQQWLEGVRRVKSRQADAITLLKEGEIARLGALWQFNIEATPALCEAFGDALGKLAAKIDPTPFLTGGGDLRVMRAPEFLRLQLQNIKWLSAHCDLGDTPHGHERRG
jgi:hypothetical protein